MRRIVLCADDYALSPGVSAGIRELAARGRINATSVMTIFPELESEAKLLRDTKFPIPFQIGLHVTLSGGFTPLVATPVSRDGRLPMIAQMLPPAGFFRINAAQVKTEVTAQIRKFVEVFGRAPDYVDGHQHVQLMPGVRASFLEAVSELAPNAWVRQCGPLRREEVFGGNKARLIAWLSRSFRRQARARGIAFNPAFSGAYDHSAPRDFAAPFSHFIEDMPQGGVVMCHPGHPDSVLAARDPLTTQRETEYKFLMGDEMPRALAQAGVTLGQGMG